MPEEVHKTKKRGRPAGRPLGVKNITVIEDEMIFPYKIYIDEHCFNVVDAKSKSHIEKSFGYFTSLSSALKKIVKMQLTNNKTYTLPGFVNDFENKLKEFETKITI
jgi:hypothetical protein